MVDSEESEPTRFVKEGRTGRGRKRSRQKSPRQRSDGIALANKPPGTARSRNSDLDETNAPISVWTSLYFRTPGQTPRNQRLSFHMYGHPGYTPGTRYRNDIAEIYANIPAILCKLGLPTCDAKTFYIVLLSDELHPRLQWN
ncbi:hypothetical protein T07_165 [Trichinella nelsoni]|uniref:Uncharacterized protein n=1 Tax=Trichinella nelsoni TaxID=6336 RepID=A0A0V0SHI5_9BILA|nr:hypothetical protein T07_165 [Trichinella nelsoni]